MLRIGVKIRVKSREHRKAERCRGPDGAQAHPRFHRHINHVSVERLHHAAHAPRANQTHAHGIVARQANAAHTSDNHLRVSLRRSRGVRCGHHRHLVSPPRQSFRQLLQRAGHAVDIRRIRISDDQGIHQPMMPWNLPQLWQIKTR